MSVSTLADVRPLRTACTVRPNRFGAFAPVVHMRGCAPRAARPTDPAFATAAQAVEYARDSLGASLIVIAGSMTPNDAA